MSAYLLIIIMFVSCAAAFRMTRFRTPDRFRDLCMVVEKKSSYLVTLLPGDGIGPEITAATLPSLNAVAAKNGFTIKYQEADIGGIAIDNHNDPFPDSTLASCKAGDSVMLACIGGYKWDSLPRNMRPETGLLKMRKSLDLYANLRPAKVIPQLIQASTLKPEVIEGVDIMVVRELTGDIYFGKPNTIEVGADGIRRGISTALYTEAEVERIARTAMQVAMTRSKKLVSVDKANVLEVSQFWRDIVIRVSKEFPEVELSHMYVDNCAMQLIKWPKQFDTIVTGNMFGDILSDEASMLVGSLGMLPSASIGGGGPGVFEPCHGSAPDIAGQDKANPLAQILSAAMMLRYDLSQPEAANQLEEAVTRVLSKGLRTGDIRQDGCELVGCKRMGEEVAKCVAEL